MSFFESLVALLLVAVLLLQVSRRIGLPYPAMLAAAGVAVALVPGAPAIRLEPQTALALFIAPVLVDAAYDFPLGAARRLWVPLLVFAGGAVLVTAGLVAVIGHAMLGLPLAAALALGAIVAPPDAAAATAVIARLPIARRIDAVLKGESLFNDATALLLFSAAITIQQEGALDLATAAELSIAVPGGIVFGIGFGLAVRRLTRFVDNTVGGTILQFLYAFTTWIVAEHLHLSAVLAVVASAMTIAARADIHDSPRMRVHSFAIWTTAVFLLNVLAFLLMGMQVRAIVGAMDAAELARAALFVAAVVGAVVASRLVVAFTYRLVVVARHRRGTGEAPVSPAETLLVGWAGMRGLVTLATAFALPPGFPERETLVLAAFAVVLATVVIQGATLAPIIRLFDLSRDTEAQAELAQARVALADAALDRLRDEPGPEASALRDTYHAVKAAAGGGDHHGLDRRQGLSHAVVLAQRAALDRLRGELAIGADAYLQLQEDLDWKQLATTADENRRIEEG